MAKEITLDEVVEVQPRSTGPKEISEDQLKDTGSISPEELAALETEAASNASFKTVVPESIGRAGLQMVGQAGGTVLGAAGGTAVAPGAGTIAGGVLGGTAGYTAGAKAGDIIYGPREDASTAKDVGTGLLFSAAGPAAGAAGKAIGATETAAKYGIGKIPGAHGLFSSGVASKVGSMVSTIEDVIKASPELVKTTAKAAKTVAPTAAVELVTNRALDAVGIKGEPKAIILATVGLGSLGATGSFRKVLREMDKGSVEYAALKATAENAKRDAGKVYSGTLEGTATITKDINKAAGEVKKASTEDVMAYILELRKKNNPQANIIGQAEKGAIAGAKSKIPAIGAGVRSLLYDKRTANELEPSQISDIGP